MSSRRPPGESWESWAERRIREAAERGEFDDLPGAGRPLPDLDRPYDELWWVRKKLREEGVSPLPPALLLRKEVEEVRRQILRCRSEQEVRTLVRETNDRIREVNRVTLDGPSVVIAPLDEERLVEDWRRAPSDPAQQASQAPIT